MKDIQGYLIIGISIIISTVILVLYFPDPNFSRNDCYKQKMKRAELQIKEEGLNKDDAQTRRAFGAEYAREDCK